MGRQGDKYGAEQGQQAGGMGVVKVAHLFCRVCVLAPHPACQGHREESPGACKGSELRQCGSLACLCKDLV